MQRIKCSQCSKIKMLKSRYSVSKSHFICNDCKKVKNEDQSESPKEDSNEIKA